MNARQWLAATLLVAGCSTQQWDKSGATPEGSEADARACAALAESFPPQCGGGSISVVGLDLQALEGLTTEGDVTWSDLPITVEGVLADGKLTVDENAVE